MNQSPTILAEGQERVHFIEAARRSLVSAMGPASAASINFDSSLGDQPLVHAAYFASVLLAAPTRLWEPIVDVQRADLLDALRMSRTVEREHDHNWIQFPAMVEVALEDEPCRTSRRVVAFKVWR